MTTTKGLGAEVEAERDRSRRLNRASKKACASMRVLLWQKGRVYAGVSAE